MPILAVSEKAHVYKLFPAVLSKYTNTNHTKALRKDLAVWPFITSSVIFISQAALDCNYLSTKRVTIAFITLSRSCARLDCHRDTEWRTHLFIVSPPNGSLLGF